MSQPAPPNSAAQPLPALPRTYRHSLVMRIGAAVFLLLVLIGMGLIVFGWITRGELTEALPPDRAAGRPGWSESTLGVGAMGAILFLLGVLALWLALLSVSFNRSVRVDEQGIRRAGPFGSRAIAWSDVTELNLGGNTPFVEGAMGTKLFVEGKDGTLITFTNRLRFVGELVDIIEARAGRAFAPAKDEVLLPVTPEAEGKADEKGKP